MKNIFILFICLGCTVKHDIEGLWELQKVDIDMIPRNFKPTYLKFDMDGSFSVSKTEGDLVGLYEIDNSLIALSSNDQNWFNTSWQMKVLEDELVLNDAEYGYRIKQLRFRKINKFPDFNEFQQELNGTWKLYMSEEKGKSKAVANTYLKIYENNYEITEDEEVIEQGKVLIDTRHKKVNFENTEIVWSATFVWNELRLQNNSAKITYRLRRED